jgi:hypothetical protein
MIVEGLDAHGVTSTKQAAGPPGPERKREGADQVIPVIDAGIGGKHEVGRGVAQRLLGKAHFRGGAQQLMS